MKNNNISIEIKRKFDYKNFHLKNNEKQCHEIFLFCFVNWILLQ